MGDLLAQISGGGHQTAPVMPTYDPNAAEKNFLGQDFTKIQGVSNDLTKNTSAANLSANISGLNQLDSGAISGINERQQLGNSLLSGSTAGLPAWAKSYLNLGQMQGAESAIGRGVGAFSGNGLSGANQFMGNNMMQLLGFGSQLSSGASQEAQGIVGSNMYRNDPMSDMITPSMFQQAGEFNTGILHQNAVNQSAVDNYNRNNSPLGNTIRTTAQVLAQMGIAAAGSMGKMGA